MTRAEAVSVTAELLQEIESLRAQLAEERQQKHEALHREYCRREELNAQLLATQDHAARVESAVQPIIELANAYDEQFGDDDKTPIATAVGVISPDVLRDIRKVAYRPINLDALHEDRAVEADECAKIADLFEQEGIGNAIRIRSSAHRAKKEGE